MMYRNCLPLLLSITSPALASEAHLGANTVATGGASTAYPSDNSAVSASPGMLALTERYDGMGLASLGPGLDYRLSGSAVDSRTARTAFGLSYRRTQNNLPLTSADLPGWTKNVPRRMRPSFVQKPLRNRRQSSGRGTATGDNTQDGGVEDDATAPSTAGRFDEAAGRGPKGEPSSLAL